MEQRLSDPAMPRKPNPKVPNPKVKVKICGITNWPDARRAVEAGADFVGFNFYPPSPRYITPAKARRIVQRLPKEICAVGVFVNESEDKILDIASTVGFVHLQLHGDESPATVGRLSRIFPVMKTIRVRKSFRPSQLSRFKHAQAFLLDGFDAHHWGGTGKTFDWRLVPRKKGDARIFLAGGITPENVGDAIRTARPYAIDVCSGVESRAGKKDPQRMKAFMRAVREAQRSKSRKSKSRKSRSKKSRSKKSKAAKGTR
jgi:phosphoribosylanthranilate isomerase